MPSRFPRAAYSTTLRRIRFRARALFGRPFPTPFAGWTLMIDPRDRIIASEIFISGTWEWFLTRIVEILQFKGSTSLDVGANIGVYSLLLSVKSERVIAFEPEAHTRSLLMKNLAMNGVTNVRVLGVAASDSEGKQTLYTDPANRGNHALDPSAERRAGQQTIECRRIDDVIDDIADGELAFVKIDVQGHELRVLQGMEKAIERNPQMILQVEVEENNGERLLSWLNERGFDGVDVLPHRFISLQPLETYASMSGAHADLLLSRTPEGVARIMDAAHRAGEEIRKGL